MLLKHHSLGFINMSLKIWYSLEHETMAVASSEGIILEWGSTPIGLSMPSLLQPSLHLNALLYQNFLNLFFFPWLEKNIMVTVYLSDT